MNETEVQAIPLLANPEIESALIGACLVFTDLLDIITLSPDDFYVDRHKKLWHTIKLLYAGGYGADIITLTEALERAGELEHIGGAAYLVKLINETYTSTNIESYAQIIRDYALRRKTMQMANEIAAAAIDISKPVQDKVIAEYQKYSSNLIPKRAARPISEFAASVYDEVSNRYANPNEVWGIETGFQDIDYLIGGLQRQEVMYIAGEPGVGKSKLALQIAIHAAQKSHGVAIYSPEMSGYAITLRSISVKGKIATRKLKTGKLDADDWSTFSLAVDQIASLPIYINDAPVITPDELRADLMHLMITRKIDLIVIDYLMLMSAGAGLQKLNDTERSTFLSRSMRAIARETNCALLTVNSMTKDGIDNANPGMSSMRGSGDVAYDADIIAFLVANQQPRIVDLKFSKTRDLAGGKSKIHLYAHADIPAFSSVESKEISFK